MKMPQIKKQAERHKSEVLVFAILKRVSCGTQPCTTLKARFKVASWMSRTNQLELLEKMPVLGSHC